MTVSEIFCVVIPNCVSKSVSGGLVYIYFHANFYFDIDCRIRKNIPLKSGNFLVLFTEMIVKDVNRLGPRECKNPENVLRIANYAFGTNVVRHPFLDEVILECIERLAFFIDSDPSELHQTDILWVCGPDVITSLYHKSKRLYPDIVLLDTSYLSHLCHGSWR